MHVSISGTQMGWVEPQATAFERLMWELLGHARNRKEPLRFHHGDCVGVDEQAARHMLALKATRVDPAIRIHAHPGFDKRGKSPKRAYVPADVIHNEKPYLDRNIDMVRLAEVTIIVPKGLREEQFGGTWHSFRHARREQMRRRDGDHFIHVIWRDGVRERLNYTSDWNGGRR